MAAAACAHRLFAAELAGAVDAERSADVLLAVGAAQVAGEDVVAGQLEQRDAPLLRRLRQVRGAVAIDRPGPRRLRLGAIHRGVGGGIDDQLRTHPFHLRGDLRSIADIQLRGPQPDDRPVCRRMAQQLAAQLAVSAGDQHAQRRGRIGAVHRPCACSSPARLGRARSLSDSSG